MRVYIAHAMTGRTGHELVEESKHIEKLCRLHKITPLDPVMVEEVKDVNKPLHNQTNKLHVYWSRDKQMIREAHVLFDVTGPAKSEGVAHEIGYARFCLWKPVVRLYPHLGPSIARFEDDLIVTSLDEGFAMMKQMWGTREKRFIWRVKMLVRSLPKWLWYQVREWK